MSWDIFIFNSTQDIKNVEDINVESFVPINFEQILLLHFADIIVDDNHRRVVAENYSIEYFISENLEGSLMVSLYGENALFELIEISRKYKWQIFDTGNGEMIDLDNPSNNGYNNFKDYLKTVFGK